MHELFLKSFLKYHQDFQATDSWWPYSELVAMSFRHYFKKCPWTLVRGRMKFKSAYCLRDPFLLSPSNKFGTESKKYCQHTVKKYLTRCLEFGRNRIERLLYSSTPLLNWIGEIRWTGSLVSRALSAGAEHCARTCVWRDAVRIVPGGKPRLDKSERYYNKGGDKVWPDRFGGVDSLICILTAVSQRKEVECTCERKTSCWFTCWSYYSQ